MIFDDRKFMYHMKKVIHDMGVSQAQAVMEIGIGKSTLTNGFKYGGMGMTSFLRCCTWAGLSPGDYFVDRGTNPEDPEWSNDHASKRVRMIKEMNRLSRALQKSQSEYRELLGEAWRLMDRVAFLEKELLEKNKTTA